MKKLFGEIDLTWKKLIIFAIVAGAYTALMAILPITKNTSFEDIAIYFEWWILFGVIIIANSKSSMDSALKCFIFFLISQPLIYLLQVPFNPDGFGIFRYYKYWFMWTLLTIPMGYIGYYIKKKNYLSMIILLPMLILLATHGLGYFTAMLDKFPHHLLSCIFCFVTIIVITINMFDSKKIRIITLSIVTLIIVIYIILKGGVISGEFETYRTLDDYNVNLVGDVYVSYFSGTAKSSVEVIKSANGGFSSIKLNGIKNRKYEFSLLDEYGNEYSFEYYFDKENNTVVLNQK